MQLKHMHNIFNLYTVICVLKSLETISYIKQLSTNGNDCANSADSDCLIVTGLRVRMVLCEMIDIKIFQFSYRDTKRWMNSIYRVVMLHEQSPINFDSAPCL